jgi:hypothetical protein
MTKWDEHLQVRLSVFITVPAVFSWTWHQCCIPLPLCNVRLSHSVFCVTSMRRSSQAVLLTCIKPEQIMFILPTVFAAGCCTSHEQGKSNKLRSLVKTEYNTRRMTISNLHVRPYISFLKQELAIKFRTGGGGLKPLNELSFTNVLK